MRRFPSPSSVQFGLGKSDDALLMLATAMASFPVLFSPPSTRIRRFVAFLASAAAVGIITCNGKIAKPLLSSLSDSQSRKNSLVIELRRVVGLMLLLSILISLCAVSVAPA